MGRMSRRGRRISLLYEKNEERKDHSFDKKGCGLFALMCSSLREDHTSGLWFMICCLQHKRMRC